MDKYCVFGNPIGHSKSPDIHAAYALQTGQQLTYEKRLAPLDGFPAAVRAFVAEGGKGANVTVPFKLEAHKLCGALTMRAQAAGAVNTLLFTDDGTIGDNTDGAGLVNDIVSNAGVPITGKRVLLLGAGGAARGVVLPLLEHHPAQLTIANRTIATAEALVEQFAALSGGAALSACGFDAPRGQYDIVINATSASLSADLPPVPPECRSRCCPRGLPAGNARSGFPFAKAGRACRPRCCGGKRRPVPHAARHLAACGTGLCRMLPA
eukprot:gene17649-20104_t